MEEYLSNINLPKMVKIRQVFPQRKIKDIALEIKRELARCKARDKISSRSRVAIAVGSRGISHIVEVVTTVVREIKKLGAKPFIVPAMGSHGGATAEGQRKVLESYGIKEHIVGAPIISSMDTVEVGRLESNIPVYFDRNAFSAQAIILINRIKPHTDFRGELGSGLIKMMVIGLGKHRGAITIHRRGTYGLRYLIPQMARVVRIKNTSDLSDVYISEKLLEEIKGRDNIKIIGELKKMEFNKEGNLVR